MKIINLTLLLFLSISLCSGQTKQKEINFKLLFDNTVEGLNTANLKCSREKMKIIASECNSNRFIEIGFFINANDIMYSKTKDIKYINNNFTIIDQLIKYTHFENGIPVWKAKIVNKKDTNYHVNGKEFMLYEGYLFRYISEFYYLIKKNKISTKGHLLSLNFIERTFNKWKKRSLTEYGDFSKFYQARTHIGAQWATVALYLSLLSSNNKDYIAIYNEFNNNLKKNLKLYSLKNANQYYLWNSTYDDVSRNKMAKKRLLDNIDRKGLIQDVTHGNHVVQYIIDSYELGKGDWEKNDLMYLSNTLKFLIWNSKNKSFSDNIDGTNSNSKGINDTGWKQTDGWMKLTKYDNQLKDLYLTFYKISSNKVKINKSYLAPQFYALMYSNN